MTNKDNLQQELKEKVKEGVKPSDLKKLKRSKSESDLAVPPPPPLPPDHLLHDQLKEKQREIETLRQKVEDSANKVSESKQVEELRQANQKIAQELKELKQQLDQSLEARTTALRE